MRDLAFIDLETTGLEPHHHEIIEIGVVRTSGDSMKARASATIRVQPLFLARASTDALAINGYNPEAWSNAVTLEDALHQLAPLLDGARMCGHNVAFDRAFLDAAWSSTCILPPQMDHHMLDTASLAYPMLAAGTIASLSLDAVCAHFDIFRPLPHRALSDVNATLSVARHLLLRDDDMGSRIAALAIDERAIMGELLDRMELGRAQYGAWRVDDGRDYSGEALEEAIDGLHYAAAGLVRQRRASSDQHRPRIYVCHPFSGDPESNAERVSEVCRALVAEGAMPIAPQVYLPAFIDESMHREEALALCYELLDGCAEVRVYGARITDGMRLEIERAESRGIPIKKVL